MIVNVNANVNLDMDVVVCQATGNTDPGFLAFVVLYLAGALRSIGVGVAVITIPDKLLADRLLYSYVACDSPLHPISTPDPSQGRRPL